MRRGRGRSAVGIASKRTRACDAAMDDGDLETKSYPYGRHRHPPWEQRCKEFAEGNARYQEVRGVDRAYHRAKATPPNDLMRQCEDLKRQRQRLLRQQIELAEERVRPGGRGCTM